MLEELFNGLPCGTNSRNIYEYCVQNFGFDKWQVDCFGKQGTPLCAKKLHPKATMFGALDTVI